MQGRDTEAGRRGYARQEVMMAGSREQPAAMVRSSLRSERLSVSWFCDLLRSEKITSLFPLTYFSSPLSEVEYCSTEPVSDLVLQSFVLISTLLRYQRNHMEFCFSKGGATAI